MTPFTQNRSDRIIVIDYGAGNVRSLVNAIKEIGFEAKITSDPKDIESCSLCIFPGVGNFGKAMDQLDEKGLSESISTYIKQNRPFLGICVGMQVYCIVLFEGSEESPNTPGLSIFKGTFKKFNSSNKSVPHMGWNKVNIQQNDPRWIENNHFYFVHSYSLLMDDSITDTSFICSTTTYKDQSFVSSIRSGNILATQFHPEKSGTIGLKLLENVIRNSIGPFNPTSQIKSYPCCLTKRIIACMDVHPDPNNNSSLIVTKGTGYDVTERSTSGDKIRVVGDPIDLARQYYLQGADEISFLNIMSFNNLPLTDLPMINVLLSVSKVVFVPLTVGGGIREFQGKDGTLYTPLEIAESYFLCGADKVCIGSDSVYACEKYLERGLMGDSSIEKISQAFGNQAVVVSIDPRRVYIHSPEEVSAIHLDCVIETMNIGPNGEKYCWYECTVKGGRESRDIDVIQLVKSVQKMGSGEILLNCIDRDGKNCGYDIELIKLVKSVTTLPVIASSGAGCVNDFLDVFVQTDVDSALAAGIFHRREVLIEDVKERLNEQGINTRK